MKSKADIKLWYKSPAKEWTDSLPLGNGRIGAMVFGGIAKERIALNEDTLWSGYPMDKNNHNAGMYLKEAQNMAREGKLDELQRFVEANMLGDYTESYLPLGDLLFEFTNIEEGLVEDYYRELDMREAVSLTSFAYKGNKYVREAFVSRDANAFIMKIKAQNKGSISFKLSFESQLKYEAVAQERLLDINGLCPSHVEPSYLQSENPIVYLEDDDKKGILFAGTVLINNQGGVLSSHNNTLSVECADAVTISMAIRSSFNGFNKQPYLEACDYKGKLLEDIAYLENHSYEELKEKHINNFDSLFSRVEFELDDSEYKDIPTDERLEEFAKSKSDNELYRLLFHYGRYLMISSSRPGNQPANLQGIWNQELRAPWSSNFTLNINTEMNYWMAEVCNLSECHEPLFDFIENLSVNGEETARIHYNACGAVSHHNSDIWCISNPVGRKDWGAVGYAFWPMSFGWLTRHLYEHYEYSMDRDFLYRRAYPMLKKACLFYLNILVEDEDGYLIVSPSTSPENAFIKDGKEVKIAHTATMSTAIVKETFGHFISSYKELSENLNFSGDIIKDKELIEDVKKAIDKLKPYQIGKKGNLMEWDEDYEDAEETHRHISHLYPLYPGNEITPGKSPELSKAVRESLKRRGDGGTGWSLGWKVNCYARLKDGDHALKVLSNQLNFVKTNECDYSNGGGSYRNLFDAHPPFQIDGNFAATAGMAEMLIQNEDGEILLLPALPTSWKKGYVKGLCAKGGIFADIFFENNALTKARFYLKDGLDVNDAEKDLYIRYKDQSYSLKIKKECELEFNS